MLWTKRGLVVLGWLQVPRDRKWPLAGCPTHTQMSTDAFPVAPADSAADTRAEEVAPQPTWGWVFPERQQGGPSLLTHKKPSKGCEGKVTQRGKVGVVRPASCWVTSSTFTSHL